jgi:protein gp37
MLKCVRNTQAAQKIKQLRQVPASLLHTIFLEDFELQDDKKC